MRPARSLPKRRATRSSARSASMELSTTVVTLIRSISPRAMATGSEQAGPRARREKRVVGEERRPPRALDAVEPVHDDLADDRAELEAVARPRGGDEDVRHVRVEVEQEVVAHRQVVHAAIVGDAIVLRVEPEPLTQELARRLREARGRRAAVEVGVV